MDSIGLEISEPTMANRWHTVSPDGHVYDRRSNVQRAPIVIKNYEQNQNQEQYEDRSTVAMHRPPPPPPLPPLSTSLPPFRQGQQQRFSDGETQVFVKFLVFIDSIYIKFIFLDTFQSDIYRFQIFY